MEVSPSHKLSVSVIVPAYNYGRYLGRAIQSVLAQEFADLELLVVDDGSTDDTRQVASAVSDPRLRYIYQVNAGLSAARNTGIAHAQHSIVAFLDADDEWLPHHLASAIGHFAQLPVEFGVVASGFTQIDQNGCEIETRRLDPRPDREVRAAEIVLKSRFMPSTVVARRECFEKCGLFDTTLRSSEDRDMWIRVGMHYRIFLQAKNTVRIRKHGLNMSKQADRMRNSMRIVIRRSCQRGVVSRLRFTFWLKVWALYFFQNSWTYYDEGRRNDALLHALGALLSWPLPLSAQALGEPPFFRLRALARFLSRIPGRP